MKSILICGSREWTDETLIRTFIASVPKGTRVIHGDCKVGADAMADRFAQQRGLDVKRVPADWSHGKAAGVRRNDDMLDMKPDLVVAFWCGTSPGTRHTIRGAMMRGIPLRLEWRAS